MPNVVRRFLLLSLGAGIGALGSIFRHRSARGRGSAAPPFRDPRLILPEIPPPPSSTKLVEVRATNRVTERHAIRISVHDDNGPLAGIDVQLVERNTGQIAETATTNANGVAYVIAPAVAKVTNFEVEVASAGYAHYWPLSDPRTWDYGTGFYPEVNVTVLPEHHSARVVNSPRLWVDVAGGWTFPTANMDGLEAACATAGYEFDEDWWVGDQTICDHVRELGRGDIWVYSGHGNGKKLGGWRPGAGIKLGYTHIAIEEICGCFGPDGGPGIVFLDACYSDAMLDELVDCCVLLAVGWNKSVSGREASAAMALFFETLLGGGTVQQAKTAAEGKINARFDTFGVVAEVRSKRWIKNVTAMTLADVQAATAEDEFWKQFDWEELSVSEQKAWSALGWGEAEWSGVSDEPESESKPWEELSAEERRAARSLGYSEETWTPE